MSLAEEIEESIYGSLFEHDGSFLGMSKRMKRSYRQQGKGVPVNVAEAKLKQVSSNDCYMF